MIPVRMSLCCVLCFALRVSVAFASTVATSQPSILLRSDMEEGKRMLVATVTVGDKPIEDATVNFFARRTFGSLPIGSEKTLDDGTAAVPFPLDLPGGETGQIQFIAEVVPSEKVAAGRLEITLPGGTIVHSPKTELPRALWAPNAPFALIAAILGLMTTVWITYLYVIFQLFKVRKGAKA